MCPQQGHTRGLQVPFRRVQVHQVGAVLEPLQLVYPQVVETTRFNPEGIPLHLLENETTQLLD